MLHTCGECIPKMFAGGEISGRAITISPDQALHCNIIVNIKSTKEVLFFIMATKRKEKKQRELGSQVNT